MRAGPIAGRSGASSPRRRRGVQRGNPHAAADRDRERPAAARCSASARRSWPTATAMSEWRECLVKGGFARPRGGGLRPDRDDAVRSRARDRAARTAPRTHEGERGRAGLRVRPPRRAQPHPGAVLRPRRRPPRCGCCWRAAARSRSKRNRSAAAMRRNRLHRFAAAGRHQATGGCAHKTTDRGFYDAGTRCRAGSGRRRGAVRARRRAGDRRHGAPTCSSSARACCLPRPPRSACCPGCCAAR